jgi:toxin ParE1/3/4
MSMVSTRETARRDLVEQFVYLARQPLMGAPIHLTAQALANVRKWRVKDFDNHLVFYQARPDGVTIVRVLHAASDWWHLLGYAE